MVLILVAAVAAWWLTRPTKPVFDGERAFAHVEGQVALGPRYPGSPGHEAVRRYLRDALDPLADRVVEIPFTYVTPRGDTLTGYNIMASFEPQRTPRVALAAHYDTRPEADRDPDPARRTEPILGANDGGSGTAVLLELARLLAETPAAAGGVDLIFFDLEDLGEYETETDTLALPFAIGSEAFVAQNPQYRPAWGVLLDMVGDRNLVIPQEAYSRQYAPALVERIWDAAERVGATAFVRQPGGAVIDDHIAFLRVGIPMVNLIHQPFPDTWHTVRDTPEYVAVESLQQVGDVVVELIW